MGYIVSSQNMIGGDTQLAINDKDQTHPIVTIGGIKLTTKGKDHNHSSTIHLPRSSKRGEEHKSMFLISSDPLLFSVPSLGLQLLVLAITHDALRI